MIRHQWCSLLALGWVATTLAATVWLPETPVSLRAVAAAVAGVFLASAIVLATKLLEEDSESRRIAGALLAEIYFRSEKIAYLQGLLRSFQ